MSNTSKAQAFRIGEDLSHMNGKTMQFDIFERFLNPEQLRSLVQGYYSHRKAYRNANREAFLNESISDDDMEALKTYITDLETPAAQLEKSMSLKPGHLSLRAQKAALRIVFQKKAILGL